MNKTTLAVNYEPGQEGTERYLDPFKRGYWGKRRLAWLQQIIQNNNIQYERHLANGATAGAWRSSTFELIRDLKTRPELAVLSVREATKALQMGLYALIDNSYPHTFSASVPGPWDLIVANDINGMSAQDDFWDAWPKVHARVNGDYLERAVELARQDLFARNDCIEDMLEFASPQFRLFCNVCLHLQTMKGNETIIIPQERLAELLHTKQPAISKFCRRAEAAGLLERVNPHYSSARGIAIEWRCTPKLI